jgi:hypothetical protein
MSILHFIEWWGILIMLIVLCMLQRADERS